MKMEVSVHELLNWVYGGDFPMKACIVTDTHLVVWHESIDLRMDTNVWALNEDGNLELDVEIEDGEELNTDPYHGHCILQDPLSYKLTSFEDFVSIANSCR